MEKLDMKDLDRSSEMLLQTMPSHALDAFTDMARVQLKLPLWQYIAGILLHAYNDARLGAYDLEPSWTEEGFGTFASKCEICKKPFDAVTFGQRVCGDECGAKLAARNLKIHMEKIERERKKGLVKRTERKEEKQIKAETKVEVIDEAPPQTKYTPTDVPVQKADKKHGDSIMRMLNKTKKDK